MGIIFSDAKDEQVESLMKTSHLGQTWALRYMKIEAIVYGTIATGIGITTTAIVDYCIFKWTDSAGIVGWLLG